MPMVIFKGRSFKRILHEDGTYDFENNKVAMHLLDARRPSDGKYLYDEILKLNSQGYSFSFLLNGEVHWEKT